MASSTDAASSGAAVAASPGGNQPATAVGFGGTDVMLLFMALIWGVNFSVIKFGLGVFPPLAFNALRVALACMALGALAFSPQARRPEMADRRKLMMLGLLGHSAYQLLFMNGISRSRAGTVALVIGGTPALIAILGRAFGFDRISRSAALGIATSIFGVVLVVIGATTSSARDDSPIGILFILASSVCWAFYTMGLRTMTNRVEGVQIAAWTLFGGAIPLMLTGIPSLMRIDLATVPLAAWGAVAYSGLMAFSLAYLFWYRGVEKIGPTRTSMYANLQPIIALGAAWISLHEVPTAWQFAGAVCVITGLYLSRR